MVLTQSPKEHFFLNNALDLENLCISKCSLYAEQCQDNEIKSFLWNMTKKKRRHADQIKEVLR